MGNNFLFLVSIIILSLHDFHITHTTLHYNDKSKSIEITIKVAIEDLEKALENEYSRKLNLEGDQEYEILDNLIKKYFSNHLKLITDKNNIEYKWIGKEISDNLYDVYLYFEIPNYIKKENINSITILNTLFLDEYDHQTNIVLIEFLDKNYNLTFTIDNHIQTIVLNK